MVYVNLLFTVVHSPMQLVTPGGRLSRPHLMAALRVPLCGWILETYDSWDLVFLLFASSYVIGALVFFAWVGDEVIT